MSKDIILCLEGESLIPNFSVLQSNLFGRAVDRSIWRVCRREACTNKGLSLLELSAALINDGCNALKSDIFDS